MDGVDSSDDEQEAEDSQPLQQTTTQASRPLACSLNWDAQDNIQKDIANNLAEPHHEEQLEILKGDPAPVELPQDKLVSDQVVSSEPVSAEPEPREEPTLEINKEPKIKQMEEQKVRAPVPVPRPAPKKKATINRNRAPVLPSSLFGEVPTTAFSASIPIPEEKQTKEEYKEPVIEEPKDTRVEEPKESIAEMFQQPLAEEQKTLITQETRRDSDKFETIRIDKEKSPEQVQRKPPPKGLFDSIANFIMNNDESEEEKQDEQVVAKQEVNKQEHVPEPVQEHSEAEQNLPDEQTQQPEEGYQEIHSEEGSEEILGEEDDEDSEHSQDEHQVSQANTIPQELLDFTQQETDSIVEITQKEAITAQAINEISYSIEESPAKNEVEQEDVKEPEQPSSKDQMSKPPKFSSRPPPFKASNMFSISNKIRKVQKYIAPEFMEQENSKAAPPKFDSAVSTKPKLQRETPSVFRPTAPPVDNTPVVEEEVPAPAAEISEKISTKIAREVAQKSLTHEGKSIFCAQDPQRKKNLNQYRNILRKVTMDACNNNESEEDLLFWQIIELLMNINTNLFKPSQGIESGIREQIINLLSENIDVDNTEEFKLSSTSTMDDTSDKILSNIRNGESPVNVLLQELVKNPQFIGEDMNSLLLIFSSVFLSKDEYENMVKNYVKKVLDAKDTLYILLMICINKAHELKEEDLLNNWVTTFTMVVLSILNPGGVETIEPKQTLIYFDKLGSSLFKRNRNPQERLIGLFFIFTAKQQELFQFLVENNKNSWRNELNINLLCTIDNFFNEKDPDSYEITSLKLAYYRADIIFTSSENDNQFCMELLKWVLSRSLYLKNVNCENTVKDAEDLQRRIIAKYPEYQQVHDQSRQPPRLPSDQNKSMLSGLFEGFGL
ncbi:unnamed protein product [Moneuplotes crassus]|uniref:Uncharacterized protein n=1 Tax=Euplotes crassus TaxID=5936 RepID=A0AAD2D7Q2_EUPCR|nr:unnamed protein product [Moneuplotes crassus]